MPPSRPSSLPSCARPAVGGWVAAALTCTVNLAAAQAPPPALAPQGEPPSDPATPPSAAAPPSAAGRLEPVTREELVATALARSPELKATRLRARAMRLEGNAEARLPAPMAEAQLWQVPAMQPHRLDRAGMVMVGVRQELPTGGVRGARARAARQNAGVETAMADEQASMLALEVEHAFTDYVEATELVRIHEAHRAAAERVVAFAQARYAAGGELADIAQADREAAMIEPDLVMAKRSVELARTRINGLLARPSDTPLGPPSPPAPSQLRTEAETLVARAEATRPELRVARAQRAAAEADAEVEDRMAHAPMVTAGVYYFAPTEPMPEHGVGASFSTTLPWLWGAARARSAAAQARVETARAEQDAVRAQIALEVMTAAAEAEVNASRLEALQTRALPAGQRAEQAILAGYESSRANLVAYLMARTAVADLEVEIVAARADLEHALTDLRWALGTSGTTTPGGPTDVR